MSSPWIEFGLNGLIMGSVITLLFFVVKWTLQTTKEILQQAAKEREAFVKAISDHTEQAKIFHENVKEAHNYQREEHREFGKQMQEVTSVLGRINGFHKE